METALAIYQGIIITIKAAEQKQYEARELETAWHDEGNKLTVQIKSLEETKVTALENLNKSLLKSSIPAAQPVSPEVTELTKKWFEPVALKPQPVATKNIQDFAVFKDDPEACADLSALEACDFDRNEVANHG